MKTRLDKQPQIKQQEHGQTAQSTPTCTTIKTRCDAWADEQNRKNERRASKPDNIVLLKCGVVLCFGLLIWCYYVYVGRICVPMIRQDATARGSRAEGIVFLIFFNILWLMMVYTYSLACFVSPGIANKQVQSGPRPEPPWIAYPPNMMQQQQAYTQQGTQQQYQPSRSNQEEAFIAGPRYISPPTQEEANNNTGSSTSAHTLVDQRQSNSQNPTYPASNAEIIHSNGNLGANGITQAAHPLQDTQEAADRFGKMGAMGVGVANAAAATATAAPQHEDESGVGVAEQPMPSYQPGDSAYVQPQKPKSHPANVPLSMQTQVNSSTAVPQHVNQHDSTFTPKVHREPPLTLPLHPNTRYCTRCEIVKPYRTHHCRHCGKCILGMDHHCPWIGQCVGARNHVFFVGFCFWACIALTYIFVTILIALIAPNVSPTPVIDPQSTVICAIAAVLAFFTGSMFTSHLVLILNGQTTIENISISDMKHRETSALNRHYSLFALKIKMKERRLMDNEWGNLDNEANLWYQGSKKANWNLVMGKSKWKWLIPFPPGSLRPDNGLDYIPNLRRGPNGEWRRRSEWPKELQ